MKYILRGPRCGPPSLGGSDQVVDLSRAGKMGEWMETCGE